MIELLQFRLFTLLLHRALRNCAEEGIWSRVETLLEENPFEAFNILCAKESENVGTKFNYSNRNFIELGIGKTRASSQEAPVCIVLIREKFPNLSIKTFRICRQSLLTIHDAIVESIRNINFRSHSQ